MAVIHAMAVINNSRDYEFVSRRFAILISHKLNVIFSSFSLDHNKMEIGIGPFSFTEITTGQLVLGFEQKRGLSVDPSRPSCRIDKRKANLSSDQYWFCKG